MNPINCKTTYAEAVGHAAAAASQSAKHEDETRFSVASVNAESGAPLTKKKAKSILNSLDEMRKIFEIYQDKLINLQSCTLDVIFFESGRPLTDAEVASPAFKVNCMLARGYLDTLMRANLFQFSHQKLLLSLRCILFSQCLRNIPGTNLEELNSQFEKIKSLKKEDVEGYKKILESLNIDYASVQRQHGEHAAKALKAIIILFPILDLSLNDILFKNLQENPLFSHLCSQGFHLNPKMTPHDAFANDFFKWIITQQELPQGLLNHLLGLWEEIKQGKNLTPDRWTVAAPASLQAKLMEFQKIYRSYPVALFQKIPFVLIPLGNLKPANSILLKASQLTSSFGFWCSLFQDFGEMHKPIANNLSEYNETVIDISYSNAVEASRKASNRGSRVIVDKNQHHKQSLERFQPEAQKQFLRHSAQFEDTCKRKIEFLKEELTLLEKFPQQAELIKWSLYAAIEPLLKEIQLVKTFSLNCQTEAREKMEIFSKLSSLVNDGTIAKVAQKMDPKKNPQMKIAFELAMRIWNEYGNSLKRFQEYTEKWLELIHSDLENKFHLESSMNQKEADDKEAGKKVFTKEALRKRIAYEKLLLPDLVDLNDEMFAAAVVVRKSSPKKDPEPAPASLPPAAVALPPSASAAAAAAVSHPPAAAAPLPAAAAAPPAAAAATVHPSVAMELNIKELQASLDGFERRIALVGQPNAEVSLIGAITPYSLVIGEQLRKELTQTNVGKSVVQEVCDHYFLLTQGMELICDCLLKRRFDLLLPSYRAYLIDCAVAVEQRFAQEILVKKQKICIDHDLQALAAESGLPISAAQAEFLQESNRALIWARYPATSLSYFGTGEGCPSPLLFLSKLLNTGLAKKEDLLSFLNMLFKHHQGALSLILGTDLNSSQKHQLFLQHCEKLRLTLVATLTQSSASTATAAAPPPVPKAKQEIDKTLSDCLYVQNEGHSEAAIHLQEISYYLKLLNASRTLQLLMPAPQLAFWHKRNQMDVEKLFKHLYEADCLLHNIGALHRHGFGNYAIALKEIRPLAAEMDFLRAINFKIAHHYHTKQSPCGTFYSDYLKQCQEQVLGFEIAGKAKITDKNFPSFEKALALFEQQLPFTLKTLNAELQKQKKSIRGEKL